MNEIMLEIDRILFERDMFDMIVRFSFIFITVCLFATSCQVVCLLTGFNVRDFIVDTFERKKTGKHPLPAEKKSRERVLEVLSDNYMSAEAKCLFLDRELGRVRGSLFVSREWKDVIFESIGAFIRDSNQDF